MDPYKEGDEVWYYSTTRELWELRAIKRISGGKIDLAWEKWGPSSQHSATC